MGDNGKDDGQDRQGLTTNMMMREGNDNNRMGRGEKDRLELTRMRRMDR